MSIRVATACRAWPGLFDGNFGEDQTATIDQSGNDNTASTLQRGENQSATIEQLGGRNTGSLGYAFGAQIIQGGDTGRDNEATIRQISDENSARINQQGVSLAAFVEQGGNGNNISLVDQSGNGGAVALNANVPAGRFEQ
jgi:hypothetical protein